MKLLLLITLCSYYLIPASQAACSHELGTIVIATEELPNYDFIMTMDNLGLIGTVPYNSTVDSNLILYDDGNGGTANLVPFKTEFVTNGDVQLDTVSWNGTSDWAGASDGAKPGYFLTVGDASQAVVEIAGTQLAGIGFRINCAPGYAEFRFDDDDGRCASFLFGNYPTLNGYIALSVTSPSYPFSKFSIGSNCVLDNIQAVFTKCQADSCPDRNSKCANAADNTGFVCNCNPGWEYSGPTNCTDIDECQTQDFNCPENSYCNNQIGSYECLCNDGFTKGGDGNCTDNNECDNYPCALFANCTNTPGSYFCTCLNGYTGNGTVCNDVNECDNSPCDSGEVCVNYNGWYDCPCALGWNATDSGCIDFDECTLSPCTDKNSECNNTPGSFECNCNSGFESNGTACIESKRPVSLASSLNVVVALAAVSVATLIAIL